MSAAVAVLPPAAIPATAGEPPAEEFHYRWHLTNLLGRLASIVLPGHGEGVLTFQPRYDGHLVSELVITSEESEEGEYWRYGAEIDLRRGGRAIRAWTSYRYGEKDKARRSDIDEEGVVDVASGVYMIRRDPPRSERLMRIWSDGKIYPVRVVARGEEERKVGGRRVPVDHFVVEGVDLPGERYWKGRLELWLARDGTSTPVAILIKRGLAGVLLELRDPLPEGTS